MSTIPFVPALRNLSPKNGSLLLFCLMLGASGLRAQTGTRTDRLLEDNWRSTASETASFDGFEKAGFNDGSWQTVRVPHNWDQYEGYRRLRHGNFHGKAWYRKTFAVKNGNSSKRYFLWFEGVGSYATVWLNGKPVGSHPGGRTSFTLDVTEAINLNGSNTLAVRADEPAMIQDLPWVCGGCSEDRGFSEGSQPLGIFRPVHLIATDPVRIEPFGVHIWTDPKRSAHPVLHTETEVKNYGARSKTVTVLVRLLDKKGQTVASVQKSLSVPAGKTVTASADLPALQQPHLWSLEDPYLYTAVAEIREGAKAVDGLSTPYGLRWISWPDTKSGGQFLLNGKPVFINGTCEYEHLMGRSHAFTDAEVAATVSQVRAAGFNAFRDAHQPHNLRFQQYWDSLGVLWWPQFSAHIWYDSPAFRQNFKTLLRDWIRERRNSPSLILWGLQNESKLPEDFAKECTAIIREMDPTASVERKVTTCNGGTGTDWDVPQNWTGTYGGDPKTYGADLLRQVLVGEYGAWRSLDLHTEGPFQQNGIYSEDRMTQLMELKVRLADSVKNRVAGHFHWLLGSHENPGRVQGGEGWRELDRVGPVNYKGVMTPWGEPLDAYYMFRANYASKEKEPMVYIVSHTWPDRWTAPGRKDSIVVYSNCDEVELFNDAGSVSLGKRTRRGVGTHFQWDGVDVRYNVLYAEGRVGGKVVARDQVIINHLPKAPHYQNLFEDRKNITAPQAGYQYLYRVNCGGGDYRDANGNRWLADRKQKEENTWGSHSWTDAFPGLPAYFASQRYTNDPVGGTTDPKLFQTFRYGMDKLSYHFPLPDGAYRVELYFVEPWYGRGGGMDAKGWRLFDVAANGKTVIKDLDIWKEAGHDRALKKVFPVQVTGGQLEISFPQAEAGEAIISAIAIAAQKTGLKAAPASPLLVGKLSAPAGWAAQSWLNTGDQVYAHDSISFSALPPVLYGAEWIRTAKPAAGQVGGSLVLTDSADVYIGLDSRLTQIPGWMNGYADAKLTVEAQGLQYHLYNRQFAPGTEVALGENGALNGQPASMYTVFVKPVSRMEPAYDLKPTAKYEAEEARLSGARIAPEPYLNKKYVALNGSSDTVTFRFNVGVADMYALRFRYINPTGSVIKANMNLRSADGTLMRQAVLEFTPTTATGKWATIDSSTGSFINAGNYLVELFGADKPGLGIDFMEVQ